MDEEDIEALGSELKKMRLSKYYYIQIQLAYKNCSLHTNTSLTEIGMS